MNAGAMLKEALNAVTIAAAMAAAAIAAFPGIAGPGAPPPAAGSRAPSLHPFAPARIPPGTPETITIPAIGVRAAVRGVVSTHERGRWLIVPPMAANADLQRVYWWSEHAAPAGPSKGTAYIYGHACAHYALCAFNRLHELAKGDLVTVATGRGALRYRVAAKPVRLAKTAAGIGASAIYDYGVVNRLVLITCGYAADGSSPWNWVVITQLADSPESYDHRL